MSRFTYTARDGTRVELPDLDALREHVAAGMVRNETPFYDASTGLEGPAEQHQAYRFVRDLQPGDAGSGKSEDIGSEGTEASGSGKDDRDELDFSGIDVTLVEEDDELDRDEVVRRLLKEREGNVEPGVHRLRLNPYNETLRAWEGDPPWEEGPPSHSGEEDDERDGEAEGEADGAGEAPAEPVAGVGEGSADEPRPAPQPLEVNPPEGSLTDLDYPPADTLQRPRRSLPRPAPRRARAFYRRSFFTRAILLVLVTGAGGYLVLRTGAATIPEPEAEGGGANAAVPVYGSGAEGVDPHGVAGMLAASEGEAFRDMVSGMDSLARTYDVFEVPPAWLESEYLADADRYPHVREFWERYATFVAELRHQDRTLFRRGYLDRLEGMGVSSSVATMRLAEAQRRFEETQLQRNAKYASMEDLSRVALELHDLLVSRTDDLIHDPITATSAPEEPALQVRTEDRELQDRIWAYLDRVFEDLQHINGETRWTRDDMTPGILQGIGSTGGDGGDDSGS